jgi:phytanoyl-CoA hydroxylase
MFSRVLPWSGRCFRTPARRFGAGADFDGRHREFFDLHKVTEDFQRDGFAVVPHLFAPEAIQRLRAQAMKLVDEWTPSDHEYSLFQTGASQVDSTDEYFLSSGDKIRVFLEKDVLGPDRSFLYPKTRCINKIGHALHELDPVFREFSHCEAVQLLAAAAGLVEPLLVQSMYIFKHPRVGGEVSPHKDNAFIITTPLSCVGIWLALEEATRLNGCLWAIPRSHHEPPPSYFIRDPLHPTTRVKFDPPLSTEPLPQWDEERFVPLEVPTGSVVLLHGNLVHRSHPNLSATSRHAFTLHLVDGTATYSPANWLQRPPDFPFRGFLSSAAPTASRVF